MFTLRLTNALHNAQGMWQTSELVNKVNPTLSYSMACMAMITAALDFGGIPQ